MPDESPPTAPHRDPLPGEPRAALLIIDLINEFDFTGGRELHDHMMTMVDRLRALREAVEAEGLPVIYVNDNFGEWHSERSRLVARAVDAGSELSGRVAPGDEDYFIIKPQFSGFYSTNLAVLLPKLGVRRLIITGVATEVCVLFTAGDAHMRDYAMWIPSDLVGSAHSDRGEAALAIMANALGAETAPTTELSLCDWIARLDERDAP